MSKPKLEDGWYWCRLGKNGDWEPFQKQGGCWLAFGTEDPFTKRQFAEIGDRIIHDEPQPKEITRDAK